MRTYPAVDLHVDGAHVAVGPADVDELDQRPNADSLQGGEHSTAQHSEVLRNMGRLTDACLDLDMK